MPNGDIPEVEREITELTGALARSWNLEAAAAIDELERELDGTEVERDPKKALALAGVLLLAVRARTRAPVNRRTRQRIRRSAGRLLTAGVGSMAGRVGGTVLDRAAGAATEDLVLRHRARLDGTRRLERVEQSIVDWIRHEEARRPKALAGEVLPKRPDGRRRARSKPEWLRQVRSELMDRRGLTSNIIADGWAYRQFVIGQYLAAKAAGLRRVGFLRAHATIDGRTTQFCRWIHGRVVHIDDVDRKLERYRVAISKQDRELADKLWPMKPPKGSFAELKRHFAAGVGLPPYHYRCRTVVKPGSVLVRSLA